MKKPLKIKSDYPPVLSPDGRFVLATSMKASLIDVDTRKPIWKAKPMSYLAYAAFDATGSRVAIKGESGEIAVLDVATGDVQFQVGKPDDDERDEGSNLTFSPCGKYIVDGSWNGILNIRSAADGEMVAQHKFKTQSMHSVIPFGDYLFVHHSEKYVEGMEDRMDYIARWSWPMTENKCDIFPFRPRGLQGFTPVAEDQVLVSNIQPGDRYRLTLADLTGELHNWSTEQYEDEARALALIPGQTVVACATDEHMFTVDLESKAMRESACEPNDTHAFSFSADGKRVAYGSYKDAMVALTADVFPEG